MKVPDDAHVIKKLAASHGPPHNTLGEVSKISSINAGDSYIKVRHTESFGSGPHQAPDQSLHAHRIP